jgi:hypothetical protein
MSQPNASGHVCTCIEHLALEAAAVNFWDTEPGILRRIDGLAQDMCFQLVNNAFKMVADITDNHVKELHWVAAEDDKTCPKCIKNAHGGRNGFYRVFWFMPKLPPVHRWCRCLIELVFG